MIMDNWMIISSSLFLCVVFVKIFSCYKNRRLPPGPPAFSFILKFLWEQKSIFDLEHILHPLHILYGPIITLYFSTQPAIFISDHRLTHQALVQKGSLFSDRPPVVDPDILLTSNQHDISSSAYGPLWRLLRRNLASEIAHSSRSTQFTPARKSVLKMLCERFRASSCGIVVPVDDFQYAMFCLLIIMCFGEKPEEKAISDIKAAETYILLNYTKFNVFEFFPTLTKILFRNRWNKIVAARQTLEDIFLPLISARKQGKCDYVFKSYVDSLLGLELPEEGGRKLSSSEMVSLCQEFLSAGSDTSTTAMQWLMAELVRHQEIQRKLVEELGSVVDDNAQFVEEEDLQRMPYLKAVVKEALRRHPPAHFVLPHMVSEEVELGGYMIPKGSMVNFEIAEMNRDGEVWDDPMEFKPERFLAGGEAEAVDITGSREVKMMPFGAGRRICPGLALAMLHLEYFVANLVREFEWKPVEGEEVDMAEKLEFTVMMKTPLRARVTPRRNK